MNPGSVLKLAAAVAAVSEFRNERRDFVMGRTLFLKSGNVFRWNSSLLFSCVQQHTIDGKWPFLIRIDQRFALRNRSRRRPFSFKRDRSLKVDIKCCLVTLGVRLQFLLAAHEIGEQIAESVWKV